MKNIVVYILIVLWLAVALLLFVPLLHSQDDKDIPHPVPTFEIDQPDIPLPPVQPNPDTCMVMQNCAQRLLLKS